MHIDIDISLQANFEEDQQTSEAKRWSCSFNTYIDSNVCLKSSAIASNCDNQSPTVNRHIGLDRTNQRRQRGFSNLIGADKNSTEPISEECLSTESCESTNERVNNNKSLASPHLLSPSRFYRSRTSSANVYRVHLTPPLRNMTQKTFVPEITNPQTKEDCVIIETDFVDTPRSTGFSRRFNLPSWGYELDLLSGPGCSSGTEELSNDSIDLGEAGRINFRTGSFMTRYRRSSKVSRVPSDLSPTTPTPASATSSTATATSESPIGRQHCTNWALCKDEGSNFSALDSVEDELDPILHNLRSDMDSLDNFRTFIQIKNSPPSTRPITSVPVNDAAASDTDNRALTEKIDDLVRTERRQICHKANSVTSGKIKKSSLKKSSSSRKRNHPFRWSSLARSGQQSASEKTNGDVQLSHLSVVQMFDLRKLAMLKLTSMLQRSAPTAQKIPFSWKLPKLLLLGSSSGGSLGGSGGKAGEGGCGVFGVPLACWQHRLGQPLPPVIYHALRHLRLKGPEADGIFRRAGGKARIDELKRLIDTDPGLSDFSNWQPYDVADMVKSFFRSLPECLITNKLSSTLVSVFTNLPEEQWLVAIKWVVFSLPDENRIVLQGLLFFLSDLARHADTNQMTVYNLSVCLAPSLFHSPHHVHHHHHHYGAHQSSSGVSPHRMRKTTPQSHMQAQLGGCGSPAVTSALLSTAAGIFASPVTGAGPDPRDLAEQKATRFMLKIMIDHAGLLFTISEETMRQSHLQLGPDSMWPAVTPLSKLLPDHGTAWFSWLRARIDSVLQGQEFAANKAALKAWVVVKRDKCLGPAAVPTAAVVDLFYKKDKSTASEVTTGGGGKNCMPTWRAVVSMEGCTPAQILTAILYHRTEWDAEIRSAVVERELSDSADLCRVETVSNPPQAGRETTLIRGWQSNIEGRLSILVAESVSLDAQGYPANDSGCNHSNRRRGDVRSQSRLIPACMVRDDIIIEHPPQTGGKCRVHWISKVDLRGFSSDWYLRQWGYVLIRRLRSLRQHMATRENQ